MKNPASKLTRIRLELEEYDFTIEYIPGAENVAADALSRISIGDIKDVYKDVTVLAVTRSMLRKQQEVDNSKTTDQPEEIATPKVVEELSRKFIKNMPRIKCTLHENEIIISAYQNHKKLFWFNKANSTNEKCPLVDILLSLQERAVRKNIDKAQWSTNDDIFQIYTINEFKECGEKTLKELSISLIAAVETIKNGQQKIELLERFHNDPIFGGHVGKKKLYEKLRSQFYWPNMTKDVSKFVSACHKCKVNKPKNLHKEPMIITKTPQQPFECIIVDTIGKLPKSKNNNEYIVTIICELTKYLVTIAIPNKEANTVAKAIVESFVLKYGLMKEILSDNGTEYKNAIVGEICKMLDVKQNFSTAHRHETVGAVERNHRFFNEYIRAYVNNMSDWEEYLHYFTFCYNIGTHDSFENKYSPFELVFGKKALLPKFVEKTVIDPVYNFDNFAKESKYKLHTAHKYAQELLTKSKIRNKMYYDKQMKAIDVSIGDKVYLKKEPYDKHKPIYSGPLTIQSIAEPNVVLIDDQGKTKIVHKNKIYK